MPQDQPHDSPLPPVLVVAGPTCSGKSALALDLARRVNGVVINADSMQVYRDLHVLTARPSPQDEALAPHTLYGVRDAAHPGSVAWWCEQALADIRATHLQGQIPILCGGTGMYFSALQNGLADIPDPGEDARAQARALQAQLGTPALHARLAQDDPHTAARLRPSDTQRVTRAMEIWLGTGKGLAWWQDQGATPPAALRYLAIRLDPPRPELRAAIAARFDQMLHNGALEEVRHLAARDLDPALPALRAHGVPELMAFLRNEISLPEAGERACMATSRYTKRQATWFRHHSLADGSHAHTIHARYTCFEQLSESLMAEIISFLRILG